MAGKPAGGWFWKVKTKMITAKSIINRCGLAGIILLMFVLNACQFDPKNSQIPTSEEIEQLWQSLPIHQGKIQIDKVAASTDSQISIEAKYIKPMRHLMKYSSFMWTNSRRKAGS